MGNKNNYKRLSRTELLEMLIAESEKCELLERQLKEAQEKLADRELKPEQRRFYCRGFSGFKWRLSGCGSGLRSVYGKH